MVKIYGCVRIYTLRIFAPCKTDFEKKLTVLQSSQEVVTHPLSA